MGALLLSARALVTEERWETWLTINCEMDEDMAEEVMEGGVFKTEERWLGIPDQRNGILDDKIKTVPIANHGDNGLRKRRKVIGVR